jgi:hypothetical protein
MESALLIVFLALPFVAIGVLVYVAIAILGRGGGRVPK